MSANLDHKSNFITTLAVIAGGLSLTDAITFIVGLIVLIMAGVSNYYSIKKNKLARENEERKKKYYDEKQSD